MPEVITIGETLVSLAPLHDAAVERGAQFTTHIAGAESNTMIGLQRLGHETGWISRLGDDEFGHFILDAIRKEGVQTDGVTIYATYQTGVMFKQPRQGDETIVRYYRDNSAASFLSVSDVRPELFQGAKIFHFTGITPVLSESCRLSVEAAEAIARSQGILRSFDPNIRLKIWNCKDYRPLLKDYMFRSDIVLLGIQEADELLNTTDIKSIFSILFHEGVQYAAIKCGEQGSWVGTPQEHCFIAPVPCNCIDPVGAGDGFNAGFLCGLLEKRSIQECGQIAAIVGAMATETKGDVDGYPHRKDILYALKDCKGVKYEENH